MSNFKRLRLRSLFEGLEGAIAVLGFWKCVSEARSLFRDVGVR
ncbi:MAG: hypothetical protein ACKO3K_15580 [Cuspidothrix sp.]